MTSRRDRDEAIYPKTAHRVSNRIQNSDGKITYTWKSDASFRTIINHITRINYLLFSLLAISRCALLYMQKRNAQIDCITLVIDISLFAIFKAKLYLRFDSKFYLLRYIKSWRSRDGQYHQFSRIRLKRSQFACLKR